MCQTESKYGFVNGYLDLTSYISFFEEWVGEIWIFDEASYAIAWSSSMPSPCSVSNPTPR